MIKLISVIKCGIALAALQSCQISKITNQGELASLGEAPGDSITQISNDHDQMRSVEVRGSIDSKLADRFVSEVIQNDIVQISSAGGQVEDALTMAEFALANTLKAEVELLCMSACLEILLLGFHEIVFKDKPLVAVHGNSAMKNYLYLLASGEEQSSCFGEYQSRERALADHAGVKHTFAREQWLRKKT